MRFFKEGCEDVMRFFKFDGMTLQIPKTNGNRSINSTTPQVDFLRSHKLDIQAEVGAIRAMCEYLNDRAKIRSTWDLMAGCGFSSRVFEKYLKPKTMLMNDIDPQCVDILLANFTARGQRILDANVFDFPFGNRSPAHFAFIDFNVFTIRRIDDWNGVFTRLKNQFVAITDSACYGFRFGNLDRYGARSDMDYYDALDKLMRDRYDYAVESIFPFGNACLVLMTSLTHQVHRIYTHPSEPVHIQIQTHNSEGFGL